VLSTSPASSQVASGQPTADDLVTSNLPLVGHIVRETMMRVPGHVDRDDLTSAGLVALVKAGQSFDPERGVPFARYAATRIRGAVLDELRAVDWAPRSVRRRARDLDQARARLGATMGRAADDREVAQALGLTLEEVTANADDLSRAQVISIDAQPDQGAVADSLVSHAPSPEQALEHRERLAYLVEAIQELPERLRAVVEGYFLEERPMAEIAAELGVTESRVSQMRAEALVLLRDALNHELDPGQLAPHARPQGSAARRRDAYFAAVAARHAASVRRPLGLSALDETA